MTESLFCVNEKKGHRLICFYHKIHVFLMSSTWLCVSRRVQTSYNNCMAQLLLKDRYNFIKSFSPNMNFDTGDAVSKQNKS